MAIEESMIELKQRDFQIAIRRLNALPKNSNQAPLIEIIETAFSVLAGALVTPGAQSVFQPFQTGSFFYQRYAGEFSRLTFFHSGETAPQAQDVLDIFLFIYAFVYEQALSIGRNNEFSTRVLYMPHHQGHLIDVNYKVRLELIRSEITAHSVLKQQTQIDEELYKRVGEVRRQIEEFIDKRLQDVSGTNEELDKRLDTLSIFIKERTDAVETTATNTLLSIKTVSEAVEGWTKDLPAWRKEVEELAEKVETKTAELNFAALSEAFIHLISKRQKEIKTQAIWTKLIGMATVIFPALSLLIKFYIPLPSPLDWSVLIYAFPLVTIELMLLYFFRIALRNDYSLKAQLLQLEVRLAVCTFVQKYAEFAQKFKDKDGKMLEKFESLVFSGITADIKNIPSQFDGIDQLASLLKGVRGES